MPYPLEFVAIIKTQLHAMFPPPAGVDTLVQEFPLDLAAYDGQLAVYPVSWQADERDKEFGGNGEPYRARHSLMVQNMTQSGDRHEGWDRCITMMRQIRAMLYRDQLLRLSLATMTEESLDTVERYLQLDVQRQTYLPGRLQNFAFLGQTEFTITTQVQPLF